MPEPTPIATSVDGEPESAVAAVQPEGSDDEGEPEHRAPPLSWRGDADLALRPIAIGKGYIESIDPSRGPD